MFDMKEAGEKIATLRKSKGMTQEVFSEKLGVTPQAVSKWETGNAMPEVALLYLICEVLNCSADSILNTRNSNMPDSSVNYEFTLLPKAPISDYSGPEWPKSIMYGSLLTSLKLFLGLEARKDYQGRQMNDDEEYILQSAISNVCFGYSYAPDKIVKDCFAIYGLDFDVYDKSQYVPEEYILFARSQIQKGYPVIVIPKEYTDTIFAVGYSDQGRTLKGLGFLDGDDQRNCKINFNNLNDYNGWYSVDSSMILIRPVKEKMSVEQACINTMKKGLYLLSNDKPVSGNKLHGYGLVIYRNWCDILKAENDRDADQIYCIFPHAFIHYENKLRTKQFFQMCSNIIKNIDKSLMAYALKQYDELMGFAEEIASIAHERDSIEKSQLKEKRNYIINMLRRSSEQESLALSYIQKALK